MDWVWDEYEPPMDNTLDIIYQLDDAREVNAMLKTLEDIRNLDVIYIKDAF